MIDIHTHLLPGVDDGSPSIAASLPVLQRFAADGVETVVCTPHLDASRAHAAPHAQYAEILDGLVAAAPSTPKLVRGWEIMLDVPGADLRDSRLGLAGSTARLVEFGRTNLPPNAAEELYRLRMSGVVPVVAHPERYWGCTRAQVASWRQCGALIQMDVTAILGSRRIGRLAEQLLAEGMVDCFASDTHVDNRSLAAARQWVGEVASEDTARLMTHDNARRILNGEEPQPVPAIELRKGMLERLRELVFRR
jgi:protein-tyrosine phosphatase